MSNQIRLFKTVARMINNFLPGMLEENRVTLAYLITGIVGSKEMAGLADLALVEGQETFLTNLVFTQSGQVGPLNILVIWNENEKEHWFFVTNFSDPKQAKT